MGFEDYVRFDGVGLATLVARKEATAGEILDQAIARAEKLNPALNAIIYKDYERARAAAGAALPAGPLSGAPFLLKDISLQALGTPTRQGSRYFPAVPADHDSYLMRRFRQAGLMAFGKTNVPELGLVPVTEGELYGAAHSPWSMLHSPGGSSGGSAAAVAAGIVPLAHANDGGGSIRIPASCCGLVGLKPSRGRVSSGPDQADSVDGLAADLVVSRSVRDTAAALDAAAGNEPGDPYSAPPQPASYLAAAAHPPRPLRIAFTIHRLDGTAVHPDCAAAVQRAVSLCEGLGHVVQEAAPDIALPQLLSAFTTIWCSSLASLIDHLERTTGRAPTVDKLEPLTLAYYEKGKSYSASRYVQAKMIVNRATRSIARFHAAYDVWLTPTLGTPPWRIGQADVHRTDLEAVMQEFGHYVPFTPIQNMTGQPAINLPLHWNAAGLPIGVQFVGRFGDELTLLQLAAQLEQAQPWFDRYRSIWQ